MGKQADTVGDAASRRRWRPAESAAVTGFEYVVTPGLVGGRIYWVRSLRAWAVELVNMPRRDAGGPALRAQQGETGGEFLTPLAAQEWVEAAWREVTSRAGSN